MVRVNDCINTKRCYRPVGYYVPLRMEKGKNVSGELKMRDIGGGKKLTPNKWGNVNALFSSRAQFIAATRKGTQRVKVRERRSIQSA